MTSIDKAHTFISPSGNAKPARFLLRTGLALTLASASVALFAQTAGRNSSAGGGSDERSDQRTDDRSSATGAVSFSGSSQSIYSGSVPDGQATGAVLAISFKEAIDRALKNNLGQLIGSDNLMAARGQKWQELSHLLPNLSVSATQSVTQIDFAALGFRSHIPGFGSVVGPVGTFDARAYVSAPIFDWHAFQRERGAQARESAAKYDYQNARELVVLATGNVYLLTLAAAARVDAAQAQLETAQTLFTKAHDQQNAGVTPAIDTLRAQVEFQARQQQLIVARNNHAKEKLQLARTIGLPAGQEFDLTDKAPYAPLTPMSVEEALRRAYTARPDYLSGVQQVLGAERFRRAATAEHLPTFGVSGNYGAAGVNLGDSHGVFLAGATLDIPIFAGGRAHADALQAEASLRQSQQQLADLRGQIDYEVRAALLDLNAADDQVQVARSSLDLANQTLDQARDRFIAGVAENLEVVQAQESVAAANENYISSLYSHNIAKVSLARAIGFAEQGVKLYLEGK